MNEHKCIKHIKCKIPNCFICDGGLCVCEICDGAEGELPTECPGKKMTHIQKIMIFKKRLDFKNNEWIYLK